MAKITTYDEHPLFPAEDDDDETADIKFIQVTRIDRGRQLWAPRMFRADELTDLADISALYGGGQYELFGRGASVAKPDSPGRVSARRKYEIPGPSRPLGVDPGEEPAAPAAPAVATSQPAISSGSDNLLVALLQMSSQQQAAQAQAQAQSQQQFMQMMTQILATSRQDSQNMMQVMMQMQGQQTQSMAGIMTAMLSNKSGGPEEFGKFIQIAKDVGALGKPEMPKTEDEKPFDIGSALSDVADIVQGAHSMMQMKNGANPAVHVNPELQNK